jgi:hypothetical protein
MQVTVDEQKVDVPVEPTQPLGDLVEQVRQRVCGQGRIVAGISVDDQTLPPGELDEWLARPCEQLGEVKITSACPRTLAREAVREVGGLLGQCDQLGGNAVKELDAGHSARAMEHLAGCLGLFKSAQEAVSKAIKLNRMNLADLEVDGRSVAEVIASLGEKLGELRAAIEADDMVLLRDQLNYELPEVSSQWRSILALIDQRLAVES